MPKRVVTHTDAVVCCVVENKNKLLLSGGEDGLLCFTDLRTMRSVGRMQAGESDAVASVCCSPADAHTAFAATGRAVHHLDLRLGLGDAAVLDTYRLNQDEVNSVDIDPSGTWMAAGDDSGEIQVVSLNGAATAGRPAAHKTLRRGHTNICSTVAFRPHRPWELLSGGLDCAVVRWDFSRLRPLQRWEASAETNAPGELQVCNPPMVHALAVPATDDRERCRLVAAARGDGCVVVYDADFRPAPFSNGMRPAAGRHVAKPPAPRGTNGAAAEAADSSRQHCGSVLSCMGRSEGGHASAANCVCFAAGTAWERLLSVGNDRRLLAWEWRAAEGKGRALVAEMRLKAKLNWVCSSDAVAGYNAYVADVSGRVLAVSLV